MKPIRSLALLLLLLGACAPAGLVRRSAEDRAALWGQAHGALASGRYPAADSLFAQLARTYPESDEGREAVFYLGALRLDPRNPDWDPAPAEDRLRRYLALDSLPEARVHRRPEATILLEMAHQLNLPPEARISGLQGETKVVTVPQRIVRYRESQELAAQVTDLKAQVAASDEQVKKLQEELDRIRRTLTRHQ
jgi:TolA-binding protein